MFLTSCSLCSDSPDFHLLIPKVYNIDKIAVSLSLEFSESSLYACLCIVIITFGVIFVFCYKVLFVFHFLDNKKYHIIKVIGC